MACAIPSAAFGTACNSHEIISAVAGQRGELLVLGTFGARGSDDGGATWDDRNWPSDIVPQQGPVLVGASIYAVASNMLYRSPDMGRSWESLGEHMIPAIDGKGRLYACSANGLMVDRLAGDGRWQTTGILDRRLISYKSRLKRNGKRHIVLTRTDFNGHKTSAVVDEEPVLTWSGSSACEGVTAIGDTIVATSHDANYVSKNGGKTWKAAELSSQEWQQQYQVDRWDRLYTVRVIEDMPVMQQSVDFGKTWQAIPAAAGEPGRYIGAAPVATRIASVPVPQELVYVKSEGPLDRRVVPGDADDGAMLGYQFNADGSALIVTSSGLLLSNASGEWTKIEGQQLTPREWTSCGP
ncbi:hypothetical protein [Pseudoduganella sp. RAF53_2]